MALRRSSSSSSSSSSSVFLFLCFHLLAPMLYTTSDASSILQVINCSMSGNYTTASAYAANVNQFLAALPADAVSKNGGFFNGTVGLGPDTVYGLTLCPADYSRADCGDCLTAVAGSYADGLPNLCPGSKTVLAMFDRCLVRYSDVNFFGTPEIGAVQTSAGERVVTTLKAYSDNVARSLKEATAAAMSSPQRFASSVGNPYVFVQCTWDLLADKCKQCLDVLSANVSNVNAIRREGQQKGYSCTVRYSNTSFMVVPLTAASGPTSQSVDQTSTSAPPSSSSGSRVVTVVGVVIAVLVVACLVALLWYIHKLRCRRKRRSTEDLQQGAMNSAAVDIQQVAKNTGVVVHDGRFTYQQLQHATSNFAERHLLGQGAFGAVYKGTLEVLGVESQVAIKKIIDTTSPQSKKDFANEITVMRRVNHRNIIQLVGLCDESDNLLLVYELMENGTLEDQLYPTRTTTMDSHLYGASDPENTPSLLDWHRRHNILIGIVSGLAYLHTECKDCFLHRDIKPSNVVLDSNFNAKLCDFGLVTQVRHTQTSHSTERVRGTIAYIDPAYVETSKVNGKSDVYSFGVVLLEVVCGEKPDVNEDGSINKLVEKVWTCYEKNMILAAADGGLRGTSTTQSHQQIERTLTIGLLCVHPDRQRRPTIRRVMEYLMNPTARLPSLATQNHISTTVVHESGSSASTSHSCNPSEDRFSTCSDILPRHSRRDEDAGTANLLPRST